MAFFEDTEVKLEEDHDVLAAGVAGDDVDVDEVMRKYDKGRTRVFGRVSRKSS